MLSVWIIEDNPRLRRVIECTLETCANVQEVRTFGRCESALEAIEAGARPAIVLLDVGLPGMDGIEGMRRIKSLAPETSIILLTVFQDNDHIFRAVCAGASGYLLKSEPIENVVRAVDQAAAGGSPMHPTVARKVLEMFSKLTIAQKDYGLTEREKTVLESMVEGCAKKQIADKLDLNLHTVNYLMRCIYRKLHVHCIASAVSLAVKERLVPLPEDITHSCKLTE